MTPRIGGMYGPDVTFLGAFLANRVVLEMPAGTAYRRKGGTLASIPTTLLQGPK